MNNNMYKRISRKITLGKVPVKPKPFIVCRFIISLIVTVLLLFSSKIGYIIGPVVGILYYYLFEVFSLDLAIKKRTKLLEDNSLEFFDVLLVILKSEKNIKNALLKAVDIVDNELSKEFKECLEEVNLGKNLDDVLVEMNKTIPSDLVANIILDMTEASKLGNNINESISLQLENIKVKRNKEIINRLKIVPLKMAILCIFFILIVLIVFVGFSLLIRP